MNSATVFTGSEGGTTMLGEPHHAGDRRGVAQEHERETLVERRSDRIVGCDEHDGVAVGRGIYDGIGRDHTTRANSVHDNELLTDTGPKSTAPDQINTVIVS